MVNTTCVHELIPVTKNCFFMSFKIPIMTATFLGRLWIQELSERPCSVMHFVEGVWSPDGVAAFERMGVGAKSRTWERVSVS